MPRPPKRRMVELLPPCDYFKPAGVPLVELDEVQLNVDELESIRLKDREGLDHEACAQRMQVSRSTFHRILRSAHEKVAAALTEGKSVRIEGGNFSLMGRHLCSQCGGVWRARDDEACDPICPHCGCEDVVKGVSTHGRRRRNRSQRRGGRR